MLEKVIKNDDRTTADEGGGTQEYANKCSYILYILIISACVTPRNNFNLEIWTRGDKTR
jgi:hypothetical protein